MHEILRQESVKTHNLTRAKAKPFHVTQTEEKAMMDLKKFYNAANVFDEYIFVERAENAILATPVWSNRKNWNITYFQAVKELIGYGACLS